MSDNTVLASREPDYLGNVIKAAEKADWVQVVMNGGPPCFRLEGDGKFCLRAERWHEHPGTHGYVPLRAMLDDYREALLQGVKEQIAQADEAFARAVGAGNG